MRQGGESMEYELYVCTEITKLDLSCTPQRLQRKLKDKDFFWLLSGVDLLYDIDISQG